jgi:malate dehydrogenase (oxaloacetate-decarboxylating)
MSNANDPQTLKKAKEPEAIPSAANSITIRLRIENRPGMLAGITKVIGDHGGNIGAIDIVRVDKGRMIRDITLDTTGEHQQRIIVAGLAAIDGVVIVNVSDRVFLAHLGGKIETGLRTPVKTREDLSIVYTPGVARVCMAIAHDKEKSHKLTIRKNTVAIVTDGTAVLGLGDIGPEAAMPVMEGKAMLFKEFGNVDAFPLCLATKDTEEIIRIVKAVVPTFGGINLEDISAPRCFEIERRLREELNIPVFHDDQHGTAVVMMAALINALKVVKKEPENLKVIVAGVGAAGTACALMMKELGVKNIIGFDRVGAVCRGRPDLNDAKREYAEMTNPGNLQGSIKEHIAGADLFVGLSGPGVLDEEDVKKMAPRAMIFAMSNPIPEVMPEQALPHVAIMATGRSDYPNQINNVLCFPGIFRGALDCGATQINRAMKLAAAKAIASCVDDSEICAEYIVPSVFDKNVVSRVAKAVKEAAIASGVARPNPHTWL